jgi:hypothetical protein
MIDISRAEQIPGWCADLELQWLAEQAETANVTVEVGSFVGRSTRAIADHTSGTLIAVDDWWGPRDAGFVRSERLTFLQQFVQNLEGSRCAQSKQLLVWQQDHTAITKELIAKTFGEQFRPDFIFIDGHHEFENVHHDISVWYPFLADGGLICGHDYSEQFPGVIKAVSQLLPDARPVGAGSIWAYRAND